MSINQNQKYALAIAYFAQYPSEYSTPIIFQQACFSASRLLAILGFYEQAVDVAKLAGVDKLAQENLALIMTPTLRERPQVVNHYRKRQANAVVTLASQKRTTFSESRRRQAYIDVTHLLLDAGFDDIACQVAAAATPHALTAGNLVGIARQLRNRSDTLSSQTMITLMNGFLRFAENGLSEPVAKQWSACAEFMFHKGYFEALRVSLEIIKEKLKPIDPLHQKAVQFLERLRERGQLDCIKQRSGAVYAALPKDHQAHRPAHRLSRRHDTASGSAVTASFPQPSGN